MRQGQARGKCNPLVKMPTQPKTSSLLSKTQFCSPEQHIEEKVECTKMSSRPPKSMIVL